MPPPGVIRNPGPNRYETLYKPSNGPPYFLTPDVELPKHVQEVVVDLRLSNFYLGRYQIHLDKPWMRRR